MILFIGRLGGRHDNYREAFQEIDFRRMFGQMASWVAQIAVTAATRMDIRSARLVEIPFEG